MPTPNLNNATVFIANCGSYNDSNRWLNADTRGGSVNLVNRLPSLGVDVSGTLWQAIAIEGEDDTYAFKTLGDVEFKDHQYLDGAPSGGVSLDSDSTAKSAQWKLKAGPTDNFYPHQPWQGNVSQNYTFQLQNQHTKSYLNGLTHTAGVDLTSESPLPTGTNWLILVAAWTA